MAKVKQTPIVSVFSENDGYFVGHLPSFLDKAHSNGFSMIAIDAGGKTFIALADGRYNKTSKNVQQNGDIIAFFEAEQKDDFKALIISFCAAYDIFPDGNDLDSTYDKLTGREYSLSRREVYNRIECFQRGSINT